MKLIQEIEKNFSCLYCQGKELRLLWKVMGMLKYLLYLIYLIFNLGKLKLNLLNCLQLILLNL